MGKPLTDYVPEDDFQTAILQAAKIYHWRSFHPRPARVKGGWRTAMQGDEGFPDLVLARDNVVIFAELKSATGRVSADQQLWLDAIGEGPHHVSVVWRPADLPKIIALLGRPRRTSARHAQAGARAS